MCVCVCAGSVEKAIYRRVFEDFHNYASQRKGGGEFLCGSQRQAQHTMSGRERDGVYLYVEARRVRLSAKGGLLTLTLMVYTYSSTSAGCYIRRFIADTEVWYE